MESDIPSAKAGITPVHWSPPPLDIFFYIYAIVVFQLAWSAFKSRTRSAISDPKPNTLYVALASLALPFFVYQVFWTYFARHTIFGFTGRLMNFILTMYLPFRFLFPVNSDLENFKSTQQSGLKTVVFITSIFFDFALSIGTIALVFIGMNLPRLFGLIITIGGLYYIAKSLQKRKVRWSDVYATLNQFQWAFFMLPLVLAIVDYFFSRTFLFWLTFHGYLTSYESLMMLWVIKTFGS